MKEFRNEPVLDFSNLKNIRAQRAAIEDVRKRFGKEYPNIIGGKKVFTEEKTISRNPARPSEVVGIFQKGGKEHAEQAIAAALKAFESWKNVPAKQRAQFLFKAAKEIRRRRLEINAWMISEVGKNYAEADADTCEAIDFLEFYGREMLRYAQPQPVTPVPNEVNELFYIPLGVGVILPPWNFPFAILVGMTSAAIVTGNTVVLKPSSDAPMMGWIFADIMRSVGLPPGVLNYLVASGAEAGDYLVAHPKTRFIAFTGSMEVGLHINELAAKPQPGQIWIKRVIAEMGGKDAIIVDSEADLDAAVQGVIISAFGFQGQKCSACSRAIVDRKVYKEFVAKLREAVAALHVGPPEDNYPVGPVVNERQKNSILQYIEIGKQEGKLLIGGNAIEDESGGYYIEPTVFIDVKPTARIAQEEIFGPVLAVIKARDFDDALRIANSTIYGLTGSVYSQNRAKLERARQEFHVGNLYFNRKCTGALVGGHPFGGFNMSGTDSKAGGRDYLLLFLQAKSVSRKVS
ncbi:MAG: L-glutamate gamma-semialdehyde dehydrogenase [Bacteroidota bacterium]|nr:L-glutamate gamma-semialdehyde dehydrogenase [Candidatus Kapabacteria bacterium]MCS7302166.1 L-glutamate gamma-semialdehyde dehydrogenase [Candidatus Kapabacteria bacterium]MCX7936405.1 L-glutamate gamma-semialdehyde dehydrogenase [Chlorobiota bacterium]MDW8074315.1 L-glutamate gamma-semialdehyde dehydrogenase [Bacteroidota bacterium]MDW8271209.1 L-glutamate gamma-semialdehyde dehydrogenase [Bacteroidota bacterium]